MVRRFWVAILTASVGTCVLGGEITVKLTPAEIDKTPFVTPVVAPAATCAAVNDTLSLLAVGHKVDRQAQVSLFKLDAQGKPADKPVVVKLPRPATLGTRESYPLSVVFHPSLPLLYVWQDVEKLKGDPEPPTDPAWKDLDHLHVYAVDGAAPELLVSLCRGSLFHTGVVAGSLGLDTANGLLYVPNLRFGEKNPPGGGGGVGWFHLDGDGLPSEGDREPAKAEPVAAAAKAAGVRTARAAGLRAAAAAGKPVGAFRHTPADTYGFGALPAGAGFHCESRDVFVACGYLGPVTWNKADRRARAQVFLMPVNFVSYYSCRLTAHPKLPVLFVGMVGFSWVHRVEHVDGYVTLVPQVVQLEGATLKTPPVVLTKRNLVAWGGPAAVYLAPIDAAGKFGDTRGTQVNVPTTPTVEGLVYSEKLDRLYVAVEKLK